MVDIHCHLLYGVDDGPDSIDETLSALEDERHQGVDAVILTPHYRYGMFPYDTDAVFGHFTEVRERAAGIGLTLFLGTEYYIDSDTAANMKSGRCMTLAGSRYVLAEYSRLTEYSFIRNSVQGLLFAGYTPVIAHAERYGCLSADPDRAGELRDMGAMIQINADAVLGADGREAKRLCRYFIKNSTADIIASDTHGLTNRPCRMKKCREFVSRKYGAAAAERMFETVPGQIIAAADGKGKKTHHGRTDRYGQTA